MAEGALSEARGAVPYILAISAASFIYISAADLIPGLHRHITLASSLRQLALLLAGIATIASLRVGP
jgi:zinc and cadmium transporter